MKIALLIIVIFLVLVFGLPIYTERCNLPIVQSLRTLHDVKLLNDAVEKFNSDKGYYPDSLRELSPEYILPIDIWGNRYEYDPKSEDYLRVYSLGSDGMPGGKGTASDVYPNSKAEALVRGIYKPVWGCNNS